MYYYFTDEIVWELQAKPTTRAEDILARCPATGTTTGSSSQRRPGARPRRSRGGINELELAIDAMDAVFNDRDEVLAGQRAEPRRRRARPRRGRGGRGARPLRRRLDRRPCRGRRCPATCAASWRCWPSTRCWRREAAWSGDRDDAVLALAANPLVRLRRQGRAAVRRARRRPPRPPAGAAGRVMPVVGVDGGNTKTLAVVARRRGPARLRPGPGRPERPLQRAQPRGRRGGGLPRRGRGAGHRRRRARGAERRRAEHGRAPTGRRTSSCTARRRCAALPGRAGDDRERRDRSDPLLGREGPAAALMCGTGAAIGARGAEGQVFSLGFTPRSGSAPRPGPRGARRRCRRPTWADGAADELTARLLAAIGVGERAGHRARVQPTRRPDATSRRWRRTSWRPPTTATRSRSRSSSSSAAAWAAGRATPRGRWASGAFRLLLGGGLLRQPGSRAAPARRAGGAPRRGCGAARGGARARRLLLGFDAGGAWRSTRWPPGAASERAHLLTAAGSSAVAVAPRRRTSTRAATGSTSGAEP